MFDAFWLGNTGATVMAPEFTNMPLMEFFEL